MTDSTRTDHRRVADDERLKKRVDLWGRGQPPLYVTSDTYARLSELADDWTARGATRIGLGLVARALVLMAGCSATDDPDTLRSALHAGLPD